MDTSKTLSRRYTNDSREIFLVSQPTTNPTYPIISNQVSALNTEPNKLHPDFGIVADHTPNSQIINKELEKKGYGSPLKTEMGNPSKESIVSGTNSPNLTNSSSSVDDVSRSSTVERFKTNHVLKLKLREIQILRESWTLILADEPTNSQLSQFYQRLNSYKRIGLHASTALNPRLSEYRGLQPKNKNIESFKYIPASDQYVSKAMFCTQFYENLVLANPHMEEIFPTIRHQTSSFAKVVNTLIKNSEDLSKVDKVLYGIGKRHARILGIQAPSFEEMGVAFLKTFQDRFGVLFTWELEEIWSRVYSYLANSLLMCGRDSVLKIKPQTDALDAVEFPVPGFIDEGLSSSSSTRKSIKSKRQQASPGNVRPVPSDKVNITKLQTVKTNVAIGFSDLSDDKSTSSSNRLTRLKTGSVNPISKVERQVKKDCIIM
ncbi:uncharacterized protein NDAI_0F03860 [Naumovozyma dairenensis CBS 421]|uniref:Globin domain-containing protein n=1 Tax=Naumovozyma dairenensis (strain ATCC 10597 / BCRC 20456 / CBS 421 / NBRC 0211 / NRRL Y-12639) TaxID=1071378 RepID=G0WD43_NAUDC|nr:hypothetical protein NDAI_0F03860 [Naumovozyma dairenensis CBS 421]CCD25704.1 hypothetical protein NDAI_0F03860 [Naumovozyma dairenensis CBS 421]